MDTAAVRRLIDELPTPLAQLAARALNARAGRDRHDAVFYLAEASLKLAASLRVGRWLDVACKPGSDLARSLESVALPSLGHWCGFFREMSQALAKGADERVFRASASELGESAKGWQAVPAFAEAMAEADIVNGDVVKRVRKQGVSGFFELLVAYRNAVIGHGAQRAPRFYETASDALFDALGEVLGTRALFAGMRLAVPRLELDTRGRRASGIWLELQGLLPLPLDESAGDARPGELYFRGDGLVVPIHPLVIQIEDEKAHGPRFAFLNKAVEKRSKEAEGERSARSEVRRAEYLDYATSAVIDDVDACSSLSGVLTKLRGKKADAAQVEAVALTLSQMGDEAALGPSPDAATKAPSAEWIGRVIAEKYRIVGLLGAGGMGTVYEAEHVELPRKYAVKMILPELARSDELVQRFRREAFAAASLNHPGIVDVVDLGRAEDGTVYMVMERLTGRSVADVVKEGPLPIDDAVRIASETLAALAVAHEQGLVHRDLKPANLFLARDGAGGERVKILDFGIAKMEREDGQLTRAGSVLGTPAFMAPEQIEASSEVDARADLYAVGATLYQLLTGVPPVGGGSVHLLVARVLEGVVERDPRERRPEVPEWLALVVQTAMSRQRDDRFASAAEMRAALDAAEAPAPPEAVRVAAKPLPERAIAAPRAGRSRTLALMALALVVAGAGAAAVLRKDGTAPPGADPAALTSASASASASALASASASAALASPLGDQAIFDRYAAAVVFLDLTDPKGKRSSATGFVVDARGTVVTVSHVVDAKDKVRVLFGNGAEYDHVVFVRRDEDATLTVLRIDLQHPSKGEVPVLTPLVLSRSDKLALGERLISLAYPGGGRELVLREGILSSKRPVAKYSWFGATLPVAMGEGGGPVLDSRGEVVGMIAAISQGTALIAPTTGYRAAVERE